MLPSQRTLKRDCNSEMTIAELHLPNRFQRLQPLRAAVLLRGQNLGQGFCLKLKKRYYIMLVSRDEDGNLNKVPVPLHYAYLFVAAAAIGMFTITGLAGSYSRMLIKTARFNQLRQDHNSLQKDYAHLEKAAHEKDIQAASLGSLASEVSALYGLTTSKLALPMGKLTDKPHGKSAGVADAAGHRTAGRLHRPL